jgi:hypothetical protein
MDKIVSMSDKTEGRDKFTKAIQYGSRILAWHFAGKDPNMEKRFKNLFILARDSRKIFRLFKSINEVQQLRDKIYKDLNTSNCKTGVCIDIIARLGFFFYWIFDNLQILTNIKFINGDPAKLLKLASWGWFVGLVAGISRHLYDLCGMLEKKKKDPEDKKLDFMILKTIVDITGKLGDLITASNGIGLPHKLFGRNFSDGLIGIGGFWASLVSLWNLYLK